ncbi:MAG TPA: BON domain-containing protein [Rudaea sp.]|jgi:osmotically-inducible protein OsmY|nr:BON domain-containing protein [Rudaea sp.]HEX4479828.1 BON domain-containing protein [Rudaea sp.]
MVAGGAVAGASAVHDRRGTGTIVDDRKIQLTILDNINRDKDLVRGNYRVKVVVFNGTVLLCGQASTPALRQRAEDIAKANSDSARMINEIVVVDEPEGFWRRRQDNAMSIRVRTALLDITSMPGFDASRVNVTMCNGTAFLMGSVSHEAAEAVVQIVRDVNGVDKVVKVFEYTD